MNAAMYCPTRPSENRYEICQPRDKWIPVKHPPRFLFHLTHRYRMPNRPPVQRNEEELHIHRFSYVKEGLCGKERGTDGVWANTQIRSIFSVMPVAIDRFYYEEYDLYKFSKSFAREIFYDKIIHYDIWRIDTHLTGVHQWYLDPNMMEDKGRSGGKLTEYLYTEESIHPRSLKLFQFEISRKQFMEEPYRTRGRIVPVPAINDWIRYLWFERQEILQTIGEDRVVPAA